MTLRLKRIKPKRVSDQVFDQLRELIFRGQLKAGEQLIPERELSEALGVSRTTVRGAINKLVVMGFLEQQQGQGTFVRSPAARQTNALFGTLGTRDVSVEDLLEVRMGLECNAAALAAQRAVDADILALEKSLEEIQEEVMSGRLGTEADVSFHMAISYATKNPVQVHIMRNFYDFLFFGIKENLAHLYQESGRINEIIRQHTAIVDAIRRHDAPLAYQAMQHHIQYVLDFFRGRQQTINDKANAGSA
jgi:GntR family transcriptional repressor for pyruvate dehydrogenase complex